jgi:hypothetical protein
MNADARALYRTAEAIRNLLTQVARLDAWLPEARWNALAKLTRQVERCREHGFDRARVLLESSWEARLAELLAALNSQPGQRRPKRPKVPALREIYDDLAALHEEFEDVDVDFGAGTISVTTEPITLDGVFLGPFRIRLDWRNLTEHSPYRVIALEPHPAGTNDGVTHPHVQDERLCEGDGREAIQQAVSQGRLGDFFLVVSQLLHTYAQGQAYVELARWQGVNCGDCGGHVDDDERYICERCDADLCGSCSSNCYSCDRGLCSGCAKSCDGCQQPQCESCRTACSGCKGMFCDVCLNDGLCSACQAEQEEETDEEHESDETNEGSSVASETPCSDDSGRNDVAVQPDGLGQTALSA